MQLPTALGAGDRAPNFLLPQTDGKLCVFYEQVRGRRNLLAILPTAGQEAESALSVLAAKAEDLQKVDVDLFVVLGAPVTDGAALAAGAGDVGFVFCDPKGEVTRGYATAFGVAADRPLFLLLDENQRVTVVLPQGAEVSVLVGQALVLCAARDTARQVWTLTEMAPVLIVPEVLERAICRALIDRWHRQGHEEGKVQSRDAQGRDFTYLDKASKSRRDHQVTDRALAQQLAQLIGRRIGPEMAKAFHMGGLAFDRFVITCYNAERGDHFRMHRDNTTAGSQHRKFALTLNLNSDEHDGGELWFPEYGSTRYKPGAGGAIIFSCSLLHEALPVRAGNRFTLLNFLSDPPQARATPMANPFGQWGAAQGRPAA